MCKIPSASEAPILLTLSLEEVELDGALPPPDDTLRPFRVRSCPAIEQREKALPVEHCIGHVIKSNRYLPVGGGAGRAAEGRTGLPIWVFGSGIGEGSLNLAQGPARAKLLKPAPTPEIAIQTLRHTPSRHYATDFIPSPTSQSSIAVGVPILVSYLPSPL